MKLVIDIPEEVVRAIQNGEDYRYDIHTTIAQGTPYEELEPSSCVLMEFGKCSYKETGCSDCKIKSNLRYMCHGSAWQEWRSD